MHWKCSIGLHISVCVSAFWKRSTFQGRMCCLTCQQRINFLSLCPAASPISHLESNQAVLELLWCLCCMRVSSCIASIYCRDPVQLLQHSAFSLTLLLIGSIRCNYRMVQASGRDSLGTCLLTVWSFIYLPGWLMNHWLPWKFPMTCYRLSRT